MVETTQEQGYPETYRKWLFPLAPTLKRYDRNHQYFALKRGGFNSIGRETFVKNVQALAEKEIKATKALAFVLPRSGNNVYLVGH